MKLRKNVEKDAAGREARARQREAVIVVFLFVSQSENHPGLAVADASRHFIDRSATPPCGDARRGMCRSHTFRFFYSSIERAYSGSASINIF